MKKITILLLLLLLIAPRMAFSQQAIEDIPSSVRGPQELIDWLSGEFDYRLEMPDSWQTPQETIRSKKGDCEDFAVLVSAVLSRLGISSDIIILKFKDLGTSHAICAWKADDGTYAFTSNKTLHRTGQYALTDAISKYYPDWEKITFTTMEKKDIKIVRR